MLMGLYVRQGLKKHGSEAFTKNVLDKQSAIGKALLRKTGLLSK
jgi:hypothetical protein